MNLTFLKSKGFWMLVGLVFIVIFLVAVLCSMLHTTKVLTREIKRIETPTTIQENIIVECDDENIDILTTKTLYKFIQDVGVQHPKIVLAQAILETGNLSNETMIKNNNLFGMKVPNNRPCLKIGSYGSNYCQFGSWYDSVIDYAFYQSRYCWGLTESQYYNYLKKHYAADSQYVDNVKDIVKNINKYIK